MCHSLDVWRPHGFVPPPDTEDDLVQQYAEGALAPGAIALSIAGAEQQPLPPKRRLRKAVTRCGGSSLLLAMGPWRPIRAA
jgi:hypothetical protein